MSEVRRRDGVDLDAEREVDLRSAWTRISERWWLPLGGLVLGAILGVLVAVGSGDVYRAEALLYLGQPFTPAGGGQLQSLQTNPKTVSEIVRSEAAIRVAANAADMQPGALRGNVTSTAVVQPGQVARNFTPLVEIEVRGPTKVKAEKAANSFANTRHAGRRALHHAEDAACSSSRSQTTRISSRTSRPGSPRRTGRSSSRSPTPASRSARSSSSRRTRT